MIEPPADLEMRMHHAWPPISIVEIDGWLVRHSHGVTQRANSVLPLTAPSSVDRVLAMVEGIYREQGLLTTFQIGPRVQPADLDNRLAMRGYKLQHRTSVLAATIEAALGYAGPANASVLVSGIPTDTWLDLWWAVDGRGGEVEQSVAMKILTGCPSLYATAIDDRGAAAVGRLALVGEWGGLYCMATRPDARREGHARAVLQALLRAAREHGVRRSWLQVLASNHAALALYSSQGYVPVSNYHYRVLGTDAQR